MVVAFRSAKPERGAAWFQLLSFSATSSLTCARNSRASSKFGKADWCCARFAAAARGYGGKWLADPAKCRALTPAELGEFSRGSVEFVRKLAQ